MTVLYDVGDGIKGEKISCEFRKASNRNKKNDGTQSYTYIYSGFALRVLY